MSGSITPPDLGRRTRIEAVLAGITPAVDDPGLGPYLELHRARFAFTLGLIAERLDGRAARVLDVGFYPGYLGAAIERMGHRVDGVSSPGIPISLSHVHLVDIEVDPLPYPEATFDLVLFAETIEHLPRSPVYPLEEMLRVARPGAWLVVTTPNLTRGSNRVRFLRGDSPLFPLEAYFENNGHGGPLEHRHNREYSAPELRYVVGRTGWTVETVGFFTAYAKWLSADRPTWSVSRRTIEGLKYLAERCVPAARDSLYCIARKGGPG